MRKVSKIFGDGKPPTSVLSLISVYQSIGKMAEGRIRYSNEIANFANTVENLFKVWAPSYETKITEYTDIYKQISQLQKDLAADEIRVSEDIRDCHERYLAVDNFAKEYHAISAKYDDDSNNLINALGSELYEKRTGNYEAKKEQLTAAIKAAKAKKKATLEKKKKALTDFINAREAYNKFKVRRLQHAFLLYSKALQETADKENELYGKAIEVLNKIKDSHGIPQQITEQLENQAPTQQTEMTETAQTIVQTIEKAANETENQQKQEEDTEMQQITKNENVDKEIQEENEEKTEQNDKEANSEHQSDKEEKSENESDKEENIEHQSDKEEKSEKEEHSENESDKEENSDKEETQEQREDFDLPPEE